MRKAFLSMISLILICLVVLTSCYTELESDTKETNGTEKPAETETSDSVYDEITDILDGIENDSDEDTDTEEDADADDADADVDVEADTDTDTDTDVDTDTNTDTNINIDIGGGTTNENGSGSTNENENDNGSNNENESGNGSNNENESGNGSSTENENQSGSSTDNENQSGSNTDNENQSGSSTENENQGGSTTQPQPKPDTMPASKNYAGTMHYTTTSNKSKTCSIDFVVDYRDLIDGNNKVYSKNLAKLSILFAADIYDSLYVQLTGGATGGNDTATTFGTLLGLQNVKNYHIVGSDYTVDKDDVTQFVVGHKNIVYNGVVREVIVVSIRGTNGTNAEWSSNFDVGASTSEYYSIMGSSHPHWKDKNNHKGFDVATNRVYEKLMAYINTYVDSSAQKSILITGHSRGAGIGNILSKMFSDKSDYKTYGYTFATPNTTTASNVSSYKNIFNLVNTDDIITYLPLAEWGFTKYGITKTISIREYYKDSQLIGDRAGTFEAFYGETYNDDGGTQRTLNCFIALANNRAELYKLDTTADGKFVHAGITSAGYSKKDAESKYNELTTAFAEEGLSKFCTVKILSYDGFLDWDYCVEVNYCPAYFMQMLANMATGVGPLLGQDLTGKYNDAKLSFAASSVIGGLEHPHMQPTYYLIARNDFLTLDELNK